MDSLQSVLAKVLHRRGLHAHAKAAQVTFVAQEWIVKRLPKFRKDLQAQKVVNGVLSISCSHSIAAQECHHMIPALLEYLQKEGASGVTDIRIIRALK